MIKEKGQDIAREKEKAKERVKLEEKEKGQTEERDPREERVRAITKMYYSRPDVKAALIKFAESREVVPRYFEGFGKRPDAIQYPSDIDGLVRKGATSFHASEEIWIDPLGINSEMTPIEFNEKRKSWDLLIDIDCPYLDYAKTACKLIVEFLEKYGIKNYGIKFSGSKGFHIIVSGKALPEEYDGAKMKDMFPEWPRAICGYIMHQVRPNFNRMLGKGDVAAISQRKNLTEAEITEVLCPQCGKPAKKGNIVTLSCLDCGNKIERRNYPVRNKKLKCPTDRCPGFLEVREIKEDVYYCENCKIYNISPSNKTEDSQYTRVLLSTHGKEMNTGDITFEEGIKDEHKGSLDLVLVAPRHLFRMPYSLHEKTALASVVLKKEEIDGFSPKDASPMIVKVREFMPENIPSEAKQLLAVALEWKKNQTTEEDRQIKEKYASYSGKEVDNKLISEDMFPSAIKKLLKGVADGKKRGLFILITFFRSLNFSPEYINKTIREWNEKNQPPLKEGYLRGQIEWHLRQKKKILPPNYENPSFYKDLGLIEGKQQTKNPLVDVMKKIRSKTQ
jgi:hypothetical protein